MHDAEQENKDIETLASSLHDLLSGELKLGTGILGIGKALKRQGKNAEWMREGLHRWIETNEEAIVILAAALGESGVERAKEWLDQNKNRTT